MEKWTSRAGCTAAGCSVVRRFWAPPTERCGSATLPPKTGVGGLEDDVIRPSGLFDPLKFGPYGVHGVVECLFGAAPPASYFFYTYYLTCFPGTKRGMDSFTVRKLPPAPNVIRQLEQLSSLLAEQFPTFHRQTQGMCPRTRPSNRVLTSERVGDKGPVTDAMLHLSSFLGPFGRINIPRISPSPLLAPPPRFTKHSSPSPPTASNFEYLMSTGMCSRLLAAGYGSRCGNYLGLG